MRQIPLGVRLPDRAVFASFLAARNSEALEHARRLASGELAGITWLCGPGGAGKTHQCLCLDDIDQVAGRADWERGIFGLLREMEDAGGRLIAAAQAPPALANWALADLGSRCAAGAVFQLRVLDENEQQAALQLRARLRGLQLPAATCHWLQRRFPRDMRSLYELLDTLDEAALAAQRRLTIPFIREVLRSAAGTRGE